MNSERLQAIKARLEAATPAPWEALVWNVSYPDAIVSNFKNLGNGECSANWLFEVDHMNRDDLNGDGYSQMACNDADLAANAPADLRDLISSLEAAQERVAMLEATFLGNAVTALEAAQERIAQLEAQLAMHDTHAERKAALKADWSGDAPLETGVIAKLRGRIKQLEAQVSALRDVIVTDRDAAAMPTQARHDMHEAATRHAVNIGAL